MSAEVLRQAAIEARHNSFNGENAFEDALADLFNACADNLTPGWVVEDDLVLGPALAAARAYIGGQP